MDEQCPACLLAVDAILELDLCRELAKRHAQRYIEELKNPNSLTSRCFSKEYSIELLERIVSILTTRAQSQREQAQSDNG